MPSNPVDCSTSCSFLSDVPVAVSESSVLATVILPASFRIQFDYVNPPNRAYPNISNILDLQDSTTGESLLAVSVFWGMGTWLTYNGTQVTYGPGFVNDYGTQYTTITVEVTVGRITIVSSANPAWVAEGVIANLEATTAVPFSLYLSNPSVDSEHLSAGGSVKNLVITGAPGSYTL